MPVPGRKPFHIVSSELVMRPIFNLPRNDPSPSGFFRGKAAAEVLFPLLRDLFGEKVEDNDFLLTCLKNATKSYRDPILDLIGNKNSQWIHAQLVEVIADIMLILSKKEKNGIITIHAADLTEMFSTAVIAKVLFNYRPRDEAFQKIQHDLAILVKYQLLHRKPGGPSKEQTRKYRIALEDIKKIIENSNGEESKFDHILNGRDLSPLRRKGLILLLYIAGGEPPSGLLQYIFWRLGQEQEFQKKIFEELKGDSQPDTEASKSNSLWQERHKLEAFIAECLRMFAPGNNFTRFAAKDLCFVFRNKGKPVFRYNVKEGDGIIFSIHTAGRNPHKFNNPNEFKPDRFLSNESKALSNSNMSWAPFSKKIHSCPGQYLAIEEFKSLPQAILGTYSIYSSPKTTPKKKDLKMKGLPTTAEIGETVTLTLKRRKEPCQFEEIESKKKNSF